MILIPLLFIEILIGDSYHSLIHEILTGDSHRSLIYSKPYYSAVLLNTVFVLWVVVEMNDFVLDAIRIWHWP